MVGSRKAGAAVTLSHGKAISQQPPVGKIALWYACLRKLPYSKKNAEAHAVTKNALRGPDERPFNAYRCDHCGQYHIGHVPR